MNIKRYASVIMCLLLATWTTGCASIIKGGHQDVTINSPTPDAEVSIKSFKGRDTYAGPLPATISLSRDEQYTVVVSAPGYKEQTYTITKSLDGWTFGNLIMVIPILWATGLAIDAMTGALWSLGPDDVDIKLRGIDRP